jgi:hypothetical protein
MSKIELLKKYALSKDFDGMISILKTLTLEYPNVKTFANLQDHIVKIKEGTNSAKYGKKLICINTTIREIQKIDDLFKIWVEGDCLHGAEFFHLWICFDNISNEQFKLVEGIVNKYKLTEKFKLISIESVNIPEEINFYKRVNDGSLDLKKYKYGYKSGPNFQFFECIRKINRNGFDDVYMCETDCFPIRRDWMHRLLAETMLDREWLVIGSPFLGRSKIDPWIALHINGAAIYNVGDPRFMLLLEKWERLLLELVTKIPEVAYDWAFDYYYYDLMKRENWEILKYDDFSNQLFFRKMFVFSEVILNFAGEPEREGHGRFSVKEILDNYPKGALIHGDYFRDEIINILRR